MNDRIKPSQPDSPSDVKHESSDVNPRYAKLAAVGLFVIIAMSLVVVVGFYLAYEKSTDRRESVQSPVATKQIPPAPRLQPNPAIDLQTLRKKEDQRLTSYGWIDQRKKIVHIPIDRAIDLLAQRGLPEPVGPVSIPSASEVKP